MVVLLKQLRLAVGKNCAEIHKTLTKLWIVENNWIVDIINSKRTTKEQNFDGKVQIKKIVYGKSQWKQKYTNIFKFCVFKNDNVIRRNIGLDEIQLGKYERKFGGE